jgi:hypothetical protein
MGVILRLKWFRREPDRRHMAPLDYLRHCVYFDGALGNKYEPLPGTRLMLLLETLGPDFAPRRLSAKVEQSCRKLAFMWAAGDWARAAESDFYASTVHESPALFGREAVSVQYHLEALVLFARSALDIGSACFGELLPPPFVRKRYDSFNDLLKAIVKTGNPSHLASTAKSWRDDEQSWLSIVADIQRGRSLRDKLAHQIEFPIAYEEIDSSSEKESAVVLLGDRYRIPLQQFIDKLRVGTVECYLAFESACSADASRVPS